MHCFSDLSKYLYVHCFELSSEAFIYDLLRLISGVLSCFVWTIFPCLFSLILCVRFHKFDKIATLLVLACQFICMNLMSVYESHMYVPEWLVIQITIFVLSGSQQLRVCQTIQCPKVRGNAYMSVEALLTIFCLLLQLPDTG